MRRHPQQSKLKNRIEQFLAGECPLHQLEDELIDQLWDANWPIDGSLAGHIHIWLAELADGSLGEEEFHRSLARVLSALSVDLTDLQQTC